MSDKAYKAIPDAETNPQAKRSKWGALSIGQRRPAICQGKIQGIFWGIITVVVTLLCYVTVSLDSKENVRETSALENDLSVNKRNVQSLDRSVDEIGNLRNSSSNGTRAAQTNLDQRTLTTVKSLPLYFIASENVSGNASGQVRDKASNNIQGATQDNALANDLGENVASFTSEALGYRANILPRKFELYFLPKITDSEQVGSEQHKISVAFKNSSKHLEKAQQLDTHLQPHKKSKTKLNYLLGNNKEKWRTNVPTYSQIKALNVYEGIDIVYRGNQARLQYDFILAPGADPNRIILDYSGADSITTNSQGDLVLTIGNNKIIQHKPYIYQTTEEDKQTQIDGHYVINSDNSVSIEVPEYNTKLALVIDPVLELSSYIGHSLNDYARAVKLDSEENVIIAGITYNGQTILPDAPGMNLDGSFNVYDFGDPKYNNDVFIAKLNKDLSEVEFVTVLGGNLNDTVRNISLDDNGQIYFAADVYSGNMPLQNPVVDTRQVQGFLDLYTYTDTYVGKLSSNGDELLFGTYLGGYYQEIVGGINVSDDGFVAITGYTRSYNFPTRNELAMVEPNGFFDAYVTIINTGEGPNPNAETTFNGFSNPDRVVFSTLIGGNHSDLGLSVRLLPNNELIVVGRTFSTGVATANAMITTNPLKHDGFGAKLNYIDSDLLLFTYLDLFLPTAEIVMRQEMIGGVNQGVIYIGGSKLTSNKFTRSKVKIPTLMKFKADFSEVISATQFGATAANIITGIAIGTDNNVHIVGRSQWGAIPQVGNFTIGTGTSTILPVEGSSFDQALLNSNGALDLYYVIVDQAGAVVFSGVYGSEADNDFVHDITASENNEIYIVGATWSNQFPTLNAIQPQFSGGGSDGFIMKIVPDNQPPQITSIPITDGAIQNLYQYQVEATDTENDPLTYQLITAPTGMTIDSNGLITWQPTVIGTELVTVQVSDDSGATSTQDFVITVISLNSAPSINSIPITDAIANVNYAYQINATDPDGDNLSYSLVVSPVGMTINSSSGLLTWLPTTGGDFGVNVQVSDGTGGTASQSFVINVVIDDTPPVISLDSPVDGIITNNLNILFQGNLSELADLTVIINGQSQIITLDSELNFDTELPIDEGANIIIFSAQDLAGNLSDEITLTLTLDSTPPVAVNASTLSRGYSDEQNQVILGGDIDSAEPGSIIVITNTRTGEQVETIATSNGVFKVTINALDTDTLSVTSTDSAGNTSQPTNSNPLTARELGLEQVGDRVVLLGDELSLVLNANAPVDEEVTLALTPVPLPNGMTFNLVTGELDFKPGLEQVGTHTLTVSATTETDRIEHTFTLTVPPPIVTDPTRIIGRLLDANSAEQGEVLPIVGGTVSVLGTATITTSDADGYFTLDNIADAEAYVLAIDNSTAILAPDGNAYTSFREKLPIIEHVDNKINRPIYLPRIESASLTTVVPGQATVVNNARLGVILTVAANTAVNEDGSPFTGELSITEVPRGLEPAALPEFWDPDLLITIQPAGVRFTTPADITFSNTVDFEPGDGMDLWSIDPQLGAFEVVGSSKVSADGAQLDLIEGGIRAADWHGLGAFFPWSPFKDEPEEGAENKPPCNCPNGKANSTVSLADGRFVNSVELPSYRSLAGNRSYSFTYDSHRAYPRPAIAFNSGRYRNTSTGFAVPTTMSYSLEVSGLKQGVETHFRGEDLRGSDLNFRTLRGSLVFDASEFESGMYSYTLKQSSNYGFNTRWFSAGTRSTFTTKKVLIQSSVRSAFGKGWMLSGLYELALGEDGVDITLLDPNSTPVNYINSGDDINYNAPNGDFSTLVRNVDGTFIHTMKDGSVMLFNDQGQMTEKVDRNGNTMSYAYDDEGKLITITDPVGLVTTFSYSSLGLLASVVDPDGRTSRFEHDLNNNVVAIHFPDNTKMEFGYDSRGHYMNSKIDERGHQAIYRYNNVGQIIDVTLPDGTIRKAIGANTIGYVDLELGVGTADNPAPVVYQKDVYGIYTDGRGNESKKRITGIGRIAENIDNLGRVTTYERDADGNALESINPAGLQTINTFDDRGNTLTSYDSVTQQTASYSYDTYSLPTEVTDKRGNTTTMQRDALGNLTKLENAAGHVTTMQYDSRGLITQQTDPNGLVTSYEYNAQGLLSQLTQTPPVSSSDETRITTYQYDGAGNLKQTITPDGITQNQQYDARGRLLSITDNLNNQITFTYDEHGNITNTDTIDPDGALATRVLADFDVRNRQVQTRLPHIGVDESTTSLTLDENSNLTLQNDPRSNETSNIYDVFNRLTTVTNAESGVTSFEYDDNDRITKVTTPNGAITEYSYDILGRKLSETSPDRGLVSYTYDANNNVITVTDARQITASYGYDELDRVESISYPSPLGTQNEENIYFAYDTCSNGIGRVCERIDESGSYQYQYDIYGNVSSKTFAIEEGTIFTTEYSYDQGDNVVQMTYPTGRIVNYQRDGIRRIQGITTGPEGNQTTLVSNIEYRADNQPKSRTYGSGIVDTREYDEQGRLISQSLADGITMLDERSYIHDPNSNITVRNDSIEQANYEYDVIDRLIKDRYERDQTIQQDVDYQYDLNGNRSQKASTATENTRLFGPKGKSNQNEVRIEIIEDAAPLPALEERLMFYNDVGRVREMRMNGDVVGQYSYNNEGLRVRKVTDVISPEDAIIYHYDMYGQLIAETDTAGNAIKEYIWGNGEPCVQYDVENQGDEPLYLHTDHLMTVRLATDNSQTITWRWQGDAFGATEPDKDPDLDFTTTEINLRFPGQYYDAESNLFYNWNRYYDPTTAKYITSDPVGLYGGINTYAYVGSKPIRYKDILGLYYPEVLPENCEVVPLNRRRTEDEQIAYGPKEVIYRRPLPVFNPRKIISKKGVNVYIYVLEKIRQVMFTTTVTRLFTTYFIRCIETNECGEKEVVDSGPTTHMDLDLDFDRVILEYHEITSEELL